MNTFNKLYNLILQSIITQDIESKIRKAISTLIKSGQLTGQNDPRIQQVKTIIKRNSSIDINGKTKLDQLLKANQKYINRQQNKNIDLDSIPQFSQKKQYPNGVVIYRVAQTKQAQEVVRKIIDLCWGEDANPWCLASRAGAGGLDKNFKEFWLGVYTAYPKHIAFQNGQLLAFCANNNENEIAWWDRKDNSTEKLKIDSKHYMQTPHYKWTPEQKKKLFFIKHDLKFNEKTKRWDCSGILRIHDSDLEDGHFPVPLGVVNNDFECYEVESLTSLFNGPTYVKGNCYLTNNRNLLSLQYAPKEVGKDFICKGTKITSLEGSPITHGDFNCGFCNKLVNLKGAPKECQNFICYGCEGLESLVGAPEHIEGNFNCQDCIKLTSLKGLPKGNIATLKAKGCSNLTDISVLDNMTIKKIILPKHLKNANILKKSLKDQFILNEQTGLYDSKGNVKVNADNLNLRRFGRKVVGTLPFPMGTINGSLDMRGLYVDSLKNSPRRIQKNFFLSKTNLANLQGGPEYIGGRFKWEEPEFNELRHNYSLVGAPKFINELVLAFRSSLQNLKGLQDSKINVLGLWVQSLESLEGCPQTHINNIKLGHMNGITSLKGISPDVDSLQLIFLLNLQNLDYLPSNLKQLTIFHCVKITQQMVKDIQKKYPNLKINYSNQW